MERSGSVIGVALLSLLLILSSVAKGMSSDMHYVSGRLYFPEDFGLLSSAIAYVTLSDVSPRQESSSEILARQIIHPDRRRSIPFELAYDPAQIRERHLYAIQAQTTVAGAVVLRNTSAYPVITQGHPTTVDIYLEQID
ncbi:MAG: YbaY family lipoprotein [Cyanobacteria bacterium P01_A01_bin.114]